MNAISIVLNTLSGIINKTFVEWYKMRLFLLKMLFIKNTNTCTACKSCRPIPTIALATNGCAIWCDSPYFIDFTALSCVIFHIIQQLLTDQADCALTDTHWILLPSRAVIISNGWENNRSTHTQAPNACVEKWVRMPLAFHLRYIVDMN